jgi:hypothetical protein
MENKVSESIVSTREFDKNFFFCIRENGESEVVIAIDEKCIGPAKFAINLEEINIIRGHLMNAQATATGPSFMDDLQEQSKE